jgi:hypothetical protein
MAEEIQVSEQTPPGDVPYVDRVYTALKDNLSGFNKTPEQFKNAMQDSAYASKAYAALKDNLTGFDKSENDFYSQVGLKKKPIPNALPSGSNLLQNGGASVLGSQAPTELTPVLPKSKAEVAKRQREDYITKAQAIGQRNNEIRATTPQQPQPQEKRSWVDDIVQATYIPAFNQGVNDLVIKPLAGATDLLDRTTDKIYKGITGEKTPEWLRKGGAFDNLASFYDKAYQERDKPSNMVSEVTEGVVGTLPLVASLATGQGEANMLAKTPKLVSNLTKLLTTTKAATAYKEATDEGKGYAESLNKAAIGAGEGAIEGLSLEAQVLVGGALGKKVVTKLAENGLFKGGKATEAVLHALGVGTVFGLSSAGSDLTNGRDIDTREAMKQFGMGLAFELPGVARGINSEISARRQDGKLNNDILQNAAVANAASNLNGESVLRTLIETPKEQLLSINGNIGDGHETLYANSIEQGAKAYESKTPGEKRELYTNQLLLKTQGDVKYISERLAKDPQQFVEEINASDEITPEQKIELVDKIISLRTQQVELSPKTEKAPDAVVTPERVKAAKQPVEAPLYTPEEIKAQNDETDAKISEFQQKFPDSQIDPLEDLPEQVVRTFDRVENDVPTDPTAINEASDWLYNKYKQLSAMKQSDTRRLTIPQIEGMQEQLEADITLLENHKLKYHGEETGSEATAQETKPAEQVITSTDGSETNIGRKKSEINEPATPSIETPTDVQSEPAKPVSTKSDSPAAAETVVEEVKPDPIRQKAIDAITHGIIGSGERKANDPSPRFDLDMPTADQRRAIRDITNGKYDTVVAKRMIDKVAEFEAKGEYPIIEGNGGVKAGLSRSRAATVQEIQESIDIAKQYKAQKLSEQRAAEFNKYAELQHGITEADFDNYENYRNDPTGERASIQRDAANAKGEVQRPRNDKPAGKTQDTGGKTVQGEPGAGRTIKPKPLKPFEKSEETSKAGDLLRSFADTIRKGKISKLGGFKTGTGFDVVWDGSLEVVATAIEGGAKIADAIEAGLKYAKQTDWYKNLTNKAEFDKQYRDHLKSEYEVAEKAVPAKNEANEKVAEDLGLKVDKSATGKRTNEVIENEATEAINEGYDTPDLIERILNSEHAASDVEVAILAKYRDAKETQINDRFKEIADKGATMSKKKFNDLSAESDADLLEMQDIVDAIRKTGSVTGSALRARQIAVAKEISLANFIIRKRQALGGEKLTSEQLAEVTKTVSDLEALQKQLEARLAKVEGENAKLKADQTLKRTKIERRKKAQSELDTERAQILENIRADFKKARQSNILSSDIPYRRELAAIAKHMPALLRNLAQEGVIKIEDVVDNIYTALKPDIDELTKRDVTDLIAGKYDEVKPTKNQIQENIRSLKTQAKLLAEIEDLEKGIKTAKPEVVKRKNEQIEALRDRIKQLNKEGEPTAEEKSLEATKKRLQANIDNLEKRIAEGDYSKEAAKKPAPMDAEALELRRKYDKIKRDFDLQVARDHLAQRSKTQKVIDDILNITSLPRALKSSFDFSAAGRQGLFLLPHFKEVGTAFKEMFGQAFSEQRYDNWISDLKHTELYDLMKESELYISDKSDPKLLAREEMFTSTLAERIPGIKESERAYTAYLNVIRTGVFESEARKLMDRGYTFENAPNEFKSLARVVNILSGRGEIPKGLGHTAPKLLSLGLFSPRFMAARIQTLYLWADPTLSRNAKILAAKDIGGVLGTGIALLALAGVAGYKVVWDETSTNFLKIQDKEEKGTTYYDILGGLPQYVRFLSQMVEGKRTSAAGNVTMLGSTDRKENPFGTTRLDVAGSFIRGKVSPTPGIFLNLLDGKDVIGQPYGLWPNVPLEFAPLPLSGLTEAYKVGGIDNALRVLIPSTFGVGVNSYDPNKKRK